MLACTLRSIPHHQLPHFFLIKLNRRTCLNQAYLHCDLLIKILPCVYLSDIGRCSPSATSVPVQPLMPSQLVSQTTVLCSSDYILIYSAPARPKPLIVM